MTNHRKSTFQHMGATVTESSTWPCENGQRISEISRPCRSSMTVAPNTQIQKGDGPGCLVK